MGRFRNVEKEYLKNLPQEYSENIALERKKNPDIHLTLETFHGNIQGRYCAMGVVITWLRVIRNKKYEIQFVGVPLKGVERKLFLSIGFRREEMPDNDG